MTNHKWQTTNNKKQINAKFSPLAISFPSLSASDKDGAAIVFREKRKSYCAFHSSGPHKKIAIKMRHQNHIWSSPWDFHQISFPLSYLICRSTNPELGILRFFEISGKTSECIFFVPFGVCFFFCVNHLIARRNIFWLVGPRLWTHRDFSISMESHYVWTLHDLIYFSIIE